MNVTAISASQVAGPLVGGAMVTWFGWRAVFLFNVPTGLVGVVWGLIVLRRMPRPADRERFDILSSVVSLFAVGGVVVALSEGGAQEWTSPLVLGAGAVALVALPLFVWMQRIRRHPLLDLSLLLSRARATSYYCALATNAARFAVVLIVSLFLQAADGLNAFEAGIRVMPTAIGMMLASPLAGRLLTHYGPRGLAHAGLSLCALAVLLLALTLAPSAPVVLVCGELLLLGVGSGLFLPANTTSIMQGVPVDRRGIANGIRSMLQNTGTVVGTAMSLALATTLLDPSEKQAAYAGTLGRLGVGDLPAFVDGCRMALYALFAVCLIGVFLAQLRDARGSREASPLPD
jgi:MFS family permease